MGKSFARLNKIPEASESRDRPASDIFRLMMCFTRSLQWQYKSSTTMGSELSFSIQPAQDWNAGKLKYKRNIQLNSSRLEWASSYVKPHQTHNLLSMSWHALYCFESQQARSQSVIASQALLQFDSKYHDVFNMCACAAGDWLQGPYVYALYQHYGFDRGEIGRLFIAGFGSSMIFGTIVGSLADKTWVPDLHCPDVRSRLSISKLEAFCTKFPLDTFLIFPP